MSDAADSDSEITSFSTTFAISLTTQKTTPPKAGSKAAPKVTKDTKTKETKFTVNKGNYLDFLKALLSKLRQSTSAGHPWLTTGIPVGKPAGMETRGSELPVMTSLLGSGF